MLLAMPAISLALASVPDLSWAQLSNLSHLPSPVHALKLLPMCVIRPLISQKGVKITNRWQL